MTKEQSSTPISRDNLNAHQELLLIFELLSQEDAGSQTKSYTDGGDMDCHAVSSFEEEEGGGSSGKSYVMKYLEENLGEGGQVLVMATQQ